MTKRLSKVLSIFKEKPEEPQPVVTENSSEHIFCPTCHKLAAQRIRTEEKVELRQNGRTIISLSAQSKGNNIGVRCAAGHSVKVEL